MYETATRPQLNAPLQTPAVHRDPWKADGRTADRGVEAARSACGNLTGSGRDMCRVLQG
ncbi:hypothetical protein STRCI_000706 [Streptomyces cinnabarinus]|uniref:Uncharacterized protein n=1 Tax=Streptomyces cinnabarinus TaxID=67287 RepID=A0ABY7K674_9ACTN|nr:hypothetical protein [Streptomyces cinnabarinus]WAZ19643.1 hypothetical protein STRCI_000706 [Streptomyces cinnabarinus]